MPARAPADEAAPGRDRATSASSPGRSCSTGSATASMRRLAATTRRASRRCSPRSRPPSSSTTPSAARCARRWRRTAAACPRSRSSSSWAAAPTACARRSGAAASSSRRRRGAAAATTPPSAGCRSCCASSGGTAARAAARESRPAGPVLGRPGDHLPRLRRSPAAATGWPRRSRPRSARWPAASAPGGLLAVATERAAAFYTPRSRQRRPARSGRPASGCARLRPSGMRSRRGARTMRRGSTGWPACATSAAGCVERDEPAGARERCEAVRAPAARACRSRTPDAALAAESLKAAAAEQARAEAQQRRPARPGRRGRAGRRPRRESRRAGSRRPTRRGRHVLEAAVEAAARGGEGAAARVRRRSPRGPPTACATGWPSPGWRPRSTRLGAALTPHARRRRRPPRAQAAPSRRVPRPTERSAELRRLAARRDEARGAHRGGGDPRSSLHPDWIAAGARRDGAAVAAGRAAAARRADRARARRLRPHRRGCPAARISSRGSEAHRAPPRRRCAARWPILVRAASRGRDRRRAAARGRGGARPLPAELRACCGTFAAARSTALASPGRPRRANARPRWRADAVRPRRRGCGRAGRRRTARSSAAVLAAARTAAAHARRRRRRSGGCTLPDEAARLRGESRRAGAGAAGRCRPAGARARGGCRTRELSGGVRGRASGCRRAEERHERLGRQPARRRSRRPARAAGARASASSARSRPSGGGSTREIRDLEVALREGGAEGWGERLAELEGELEAVQGRASPAGAQGRAWWLLLHERLQAADQTAARRAGGPGRRAAGAAAAAPVPGCRAGARPGAAGAHPSAARRRRGAIRQPERRHARAARGAGAARVGPAAAGAGGRGALPRSSTTPWSMPTRAGSRP